MNEDDLDCWLSWDGKNIKGNRESIDAVRVALHEAGNVPALKEIIAALSRVPEVWQPISAVPKDGTWFLGWRDHSTKPLLLRWDVAYDAAENECGEHVYHLTHWMSFAAPKSR